MTTTDGDEKPATISLPTSNDDDGELWDALTRCPNPVREGLAVMLRRIGYGMRALDAEECPQLLTYPCGENMSDTYCVDGILYDADSDGERPYDGEYGFLRNPCPFCKPREFTERQISGTLKAPLCAIDDEPLPGGTRINYHHGPFLTMSATCPDHGPQPVCLSDLGDNTHPWVIWSEEDTTDE